MASAEVISESRADRPKEFLSQGVSHEVLDVHDGCVVFTAEPSASLAFLGMGKVTRVAPWHLSTCTILLP